MAHGSPASAFDDVPLDEAGRMSRGPRMAPELYHALTQNIPSLDASASGWQGHLRPILGRSRGRGGHES